MTTFYRCPECGTFHSAEPMPADPRLRINGGPRTCTDCRRSQYQYDDDRAAARDDAYYG